MPPDGACAVRIRLRLRLQGPPPSITCRTLTEDAVSAEIQHSATFLRWLERDNGGKPLGVDEPRVCNGTLTWLGSDGKDIDAPVEVEFTYWPEVRPGSTPKKKRKPDGARAVGDAVAAIAPALERIVASAVRESTAQVKAALELAKQHADKLEKQLDREAERVDCAIEEMADRSKTGAQAPAPSGGGLRTLFDLVGVAKDVKSFLN